MSHADVVNLLEDLENDLFHANLSLFQRKQAELSIQLSKEGKSAQVEIILNPRM